MRSWIGNAAGGIVAAAVITAVWWIGSQPHSTPRYELRDLAASPLCVTEAGAPLPGSPTVEAAWERLTGQPIARSQPVYHGASIELSYDKDGTVIPVGFIRIGAHRWRPASASSTMAWVESVCGTSR